jgi:hypothetical protein
MPFDSLPTEHPRADELAFLDRMAEMLATPDRWCQGVLHKRRFWGFRSDKHCIHGALNVAEHGNYRYDALYDGGVASFRSRAAFNVNCALEALTPTGNLIEFNNDLRTTHADILNLIALARQSFEVAP